MAAPTLLQIMEGLRDRLLTIENLNVATVMPDQVIGPTAAVGVPPVLEYHSTMARGAFTTAPTITVFTSTSDVVNGQNALSEFASPTGTRSIRAAVEADRTLGGVVSDCFVQSFDPQGTDEVGGTPVYVGVFTLFCIAPGA